jgi:hypothetical protein
MNLIIILVVGIGIVMIDDNPKDLPVIIEESLICQPANEGWCIGWKEESTNVTNFNGIIGESV